MLFLEFFDIFLQEKTNQIGRLYTEYVTSTFFCIYEDFPKLKSQSFQTPLTPVSDRKSIQHSKKLFSTEFQAFPLSIFQSVTHTKRGQFYIFLEKCVSVTVYVIKQRTGFRLKTSLSTKSFYFSNKFSNNFLIPFKIPLYLRQGLGRVDKTKLIEHFIQHFIWWYVVHNYPFLLILSPSLILVLTNMIKKLRQFLTGSLKNELKIIESTLMDIFPTLRTTILSSAHSRQNDYRSCSFYCTPKATS